MKQITLAALAALTLAAPAAAQVKLNGAGATFPNIIYQDWMHDVQQDTPGRARLNYQSIGSGGGIRQFSDGTVDFGASDAPDDRLRHRGDPGQRAAHPHRARRGGADLQPGRTSPPR